MENKQVSYTEMRNQFQNLYFTNLAPCLLKYETKRKQKITFIIFLAVFLTILDISFFFIFEKFDILSCSYIIFLIFAISFFFWSSMKKSFEEFIKKNIMNKVCKCFGNLTWSCNEYVQDSLIAASNLMTFYNIVYYDDIFHGSYLNVPYEIFESEMSLKAGKDSSTIFKGVIVKIVMNKSFIGNTVIKPDSILHLSTNNKLRHTTLEDFVFEKKFDVFTDNEVEARYLITPTFMERLNNMKVTFNAKKLSCAFYDKYLFVGLETKKDMFSICSLVKPINDSKQFFTMFEEILSIVKLIDYFKLNQKIGL